MWKRDLIIEGVICIHILNAKMEKMRCNALTNTSNEDLLPPQLILYAKVPTTMMGKIKHHPSLFLQRPVMATQSAGKVLMSRVVI